MPRLSLCLLVKNESKNLARAIRSFEGVADEIVVADTGSIDDTKSIAESLGAKVFDFPWRKDFGAVRNFVFGKATGDWIFHLDADEELLPESKDELLGLLDQPKTQGAYVLRQDLVNADDLNRFTEMLQLRLFRKDKLPKQIGRCHPHFEPPLEEIAALYGRRVVNSEVRLRHYGYVAEIRPEKLRRGVELIRLELEERPGQIYYLAELCRALFDLGDPAAAEALKETGDALLPHIGNDHAPSPAAALFLELLLALREDVLPTSWSHDLALELAERWFPDSPPIFWQAGKVGFMKGDFELAAKCLERVAKLAHAGSYGKQTSFSPAVFGDELWLHLGIAYVRTGRLEEALEAFSRVDASGPLGAAASENTGAVQQILRS